MQKWFQENPDKAKRSVGNGLPKLHANDSNLEDIFNSAVPKIKV